MDKVAVTYINTHMAHGLAAPRCGKKHEIARFKPAPVDALAIYLLLARAARQLDTGGLLKYRHHEA